MIAPEDPPVKKVQSTPLVAPPLVQAYSKTPAPEKEKKLTEPTADAAKHPVESDPPPESLPPVDASEVHVPGDVSINITDPRHCLAKVLENFHGFIGFEPNGEKGYIVKKFRPGDWSPVEIQGLESVGAAGLALAINDPYEFINTLRERNGLPARNYTAVALFTTDFDDRVVDILRHRIGNLGLRGDVGYADLELDPQEGVVLVAGSVRMRSVPGPAH